MDPAESARFRKQIDDLITSDNVDCIYKDVMLSYVKKRNSDFPNLTILNELLPTDFPVIIAHKPFNKNPVKPATESTFFESFTRPDKPLKKVSQGSDVEGSPLKLQMCADFSAFETSFECNTPREEISIDSEELKFGIPLAVARRLTSWFNQFINLQNDANALVSSLLCFCDGHDRKRTACINSVVLRSVNGNYLGLKSTIVHVTDPVLNNDHLPNLRKLDVSRKQIACRAIYDILNDSKEENQWYKDNLQYRGSLMLDVIWTQQHANINILHSPPPEATTTIKASIIIPGNMRSPAYFLYQELTVLKSFIKGLHCSQITWVPEEQRKINIMKSVKDLFEKLKLGDEYLKRKEKPSAEETNLSDIANKLVFEERENFDFTDHLWKILCNCSSYQELIEPLKYVFSALSNKELQPMVHRGNNTMVAQLVRDSFSGKLRIPNLAGLYPVELLVEIGIEKLRQDYLHAFLSKDLVTQENLEPYLKPEGEFNVQLIQLEKMHSVIEMISMFQSFLDIPLQTVSAISREMIQHYEKNAVSEGHLFEFIVPTISVIKYMEDCPPSTWQLESAKLVENVTESLTFLLTSDPPFKHLPVNDTNMNTKDEGNETNMTKIDETLCNEKMKRPYFFVKKIEGVSILV